MKVTRERNKAKSYARCRVLRLEAVKGATHFRTGVFHPSFGLVCEMKFPKEVATVEFAKKMQQAVWCLINLEAQEEKAAARSITPGGSS